GDKTPDQKSSTALRGSFAGIRNDAQARRPNAVRPALALADLGAQPGLVLINALLRAKAFERSTVPHQAELAVAVRAVVLHGFLPEWRLYRRGLGDGVGRGPRNTPLSQHPLHFRLFL